MPILPSSNSAKFRDMDEVANLKPVDVIMHCLMKAIKCKWVWGKDGLIVKRGKSMRLGEKLAPAPVRLP
jgi:hypothetical protein